METKKQLEFRRTTDDVVYKFLPAGVENGKPAWKRVDKTLWTLWKEDTGWCCVDQAGTELAWPSQEGIIIQDHGEQVPQCIWISKKGEKSYTYHSFIRHSYCQNRFDFVLR